MVYSINRRNTELVSIGGDLVRYNMRREREKNGMSISEAAAQIGVHQNALMRWELGEVDPMAGNVVKLARLYGVTVEFLLEQTEDPNGTAVAKGVE